MKNLLQIPQENYEALRLALDAQNGFPNGATDTSIPANKPAQADGNVYAIVPSEWQTDLFAQYIVDESTWIAGQPKKQLR